MPGPQPPPIILTQRQRNMLAHLARRATSTQRLARRARIVLAAAEGANNEQIAERLGINRETSRLWRGGWLENEERLGVAEEAGMVLWLETAREGWRVVQISEADLAALLRESCAGVRRVVHPFAAEVTGKGPASVDREDFLRALSGERSRQGEGAGRKKPPRVSAGKERDFW